MCSRHSSISEWAEEALNEDICLVCGQTSWETCRLSNRWKWDGEAHGLGLPQRESTTQTCFPGTAADPCLRCVVPWVWACDSVLCVFSFLYLKPELDLHSSEARVWDVLSVTASPLMGPVFTAFWDNDNFLSPKFIPCSPCAFSCSDFPARLHQMLLLDEVSFFSWNLRIPPPKSSRETLVTLCLEMALNRNLGPKHKTLGQPYHSIGIL